MTRKKEEQLVVVDIRITDSAKVPPAFYLDPEVQAALRNAVRTAVVLNGKRVPPGCEPIYGPPEGTSAAAAVRLAVAKSNFARAVAAELPRLIALWLLLSATLIGFLLWRGF